MRLSRFTPVNLIEIQSPRWKDRTVGVANYRLSSHNKLIIKHLKADGSKLYPLPFYLSGENARQYPTQILPSGVKLYLIPLSDLEVFEEYSEGGDEPAR